MTENCTSGFFCVGECLSSNQICDGISDCPDGSDELTCVVDGLVECRLDQFSCPNCTRKCISLAKICDGINDCTDGVDESTCSKLATDQQ